MSEWDPERESYEPESDFRRDYVMPGLGYGSAEVRDGRRHSDLQRGVWTIGGRPQQVYRGGYGDRGRGLPDRDRGPGPVGPHVGKGPRGYRRSDERIYEDVCDRLERDPFVDASDIDVTVREGEVTLSGTIADRRMKRLAEDLAAFCNGVRDVHNRLTIAAPSEPRSAR